MDRSEQDPWIQVIGRIAVHRPGLESHEPTGASRVLLSVLVAAGPQGASLEQIAEAYWTEKRPASWQVALRVSASHLSAQLPDGWDVVASEGRFRLVPGDGFVDVWRVDEYVTTGQGSTPATWLDPGAPFAGLAGLEIVDTAIHRLTPMIDELINRSARAPIDPPTSVPDMGTRRIRRIQDLQRAIVLAPHDQQAVLASAAASDDVTEGHIVVGDRRLSLPLGPFAMTFPELRNEIRLEQGVVEPGSAARAFRVVADSLAARAAYRPQRLVLANAHELDTKSLMLASLLIERGRLTEFSLVVYADSTYRDLRWLDFVNRSVTAGCDLIELPAE